MNLSQLQQNAYIPYSQKACHAVVQSIDSAYFAGVRVENAVFPLRITAVQNAIFCCLSEGETPQTLYVPESVGVQNHVHFWQQEYNIAIEPISQLEEPEFASVLHETASIENRLQELLEAKLARYSEFPVAALLITPNGIVSGVNIEPSDWGQGLCAERVALGKALSYGISQFKELHVASRYGEYSSPCGACRQVIIEHLPHHPVHLHHADGSRSLHYSSDLLPYSFQSSTLAK